MKEEIIQNINQGLEAASMEILLQIWNINRVLYQTIQKRVKKLFLLLKKSYFAVNNSRLVWHLSQWEELRPSCRR